MARPRLLDLFCCAGGAGYGYHRAGFEVVGVDITPQPNYPFEFHQGDALEFLSEHGHKFDVIHASPPCQASSALTKGNRKREGWTDEHVDLIPATRRLLDASGPLYIIENVQGSSLRRDLTLCGLMFDLRVFRHRYFELGGWELGKFTHPSHKGHRVAGWRHGVKYDGDMVAVYGDGGGKGSVFDWQCALGIDWTDNKRELAEAIPPKYTEWIGQQLRRQFG
jgi:DNA (cytosine-5)-methyltransferase 1